MEPDEVIDDDPNAEPPQPKTKARVEAKAAEPEPEVNGVEFTAIMNHKLAVPIRAHGEDIEELRWREPTAGDIERAGNPIILEFREDEDYPRMRFDERKMSAMIGLLTSIPPSSVKLISAGDWQSIAFKLSRFFMPRAG
jgi:hypothetical protein